MERDGGALRDLAVELAALAGFSDPWRFSLRRLELAARRRRIEEWNRLASLRFELRRILLKEPGVKFPCDLNPIYTEEERKEIRKEAKKLALERTPKASGAEVFAMLTGQ